MSRNLNIDGKVSVCLLTYNHAHVICSTLDTIFRQTVTDLEIVVSDDCSSDGTWEQVERLAAVDNRVRAFRTPRNLGMPGNANFCVSRSDRPYIALLHHDDLYRTDLLAEWSRLLDDHKDINFVFNAYETFGTGYIYKEDMPSGRHDGRWLLENVLFPRWDCAVRGTAMIRRSAWDAVGGMREQFGLVADIDLWMRLSQRGAVGYLARPLIVVRHQRPGDYPTDYMGNFWSWRRRRYIYEIHAHNLLDVLDFSTLAGKLRWLRFRWRVNIDSAKWLAYAVVRGRTRMITTSAESVTPYDFWWLRVFRGIVQAVTPIIIANISRTPRVD